MLKYFEAKSESVCSDKNEVFRSKKIVSLMFLKPLIKCIWNKNKLNVQSKKRTYQTDQRE